MGILQSCRAGRHFGCADHGLMLSATARRRHESEQNCRARLPGLYRAGAAGHLGQAFRPAALFGGHRAYALHLSRLRYYGPLGSHVIGAFEKEDFVFGSMGHRNEAPRPCEREICFRGLCSRDGLFRRNRRSRGVRNT